jgi:hypothetical protein
MQGNSWIASVLVSDGPNGLYHVTVTSLGDTQDDALAGAKFVLDVFAKGRLAYIRVNPEAHSYTDYDTKRTVNRGFARFSFKIEAGEWQPVADRSVIIGFGDLQCKASI